MLGNTLGIAEGLTYRYGSITPTNIFSFNPAKEKRMIPYFLNDDEDEIPDAEIESIKKDITPPEEDEEEEEDDISRTSEMTDEDDDEEENDAKKDVEKEEDEEDEDEE